MRICIGPVAFSYPYKTNVYQFKNPIRPIDVNFSLRISVLILVDSDDLR